MWGDALPARYDVWRTSGPDEYEYGEDPGPDCDDDPEPYNPGWDIYGNEVEESAACPHCGQRDADRLALHDFDNSLTIHCACGVWYKLEG